jgi:hypothetical protein
MKFLLCFLVAISSALTFGQQQAPQQPDGLNGLSWMEGDWSGTQNFNTNGGPAMAGDATDRIEVGIKGKYLCEMLSTTLPGRKPTDTRHFISYDSQSAHYTAWWFNDTSNRPTELSGELTNRKLVLISNPSAPGPVLRATYESPAEGKLTFLLEMKMGESWTQLFLTTYSKTASLAEQP